MNNVSRPLGIVAVSAAAAAAVAGTVVAVAGLTGLTGLGRGPIVDGMSTPTAPAHDAAHVLTPVVSATPSTPNNPNRPSIPSGSGAVAVHPLSDPAHHALLVIGASYAAGWGATSPQDSFAHDLGTALGWPTTVSAEPGAGYQAPGNDGHDDFEQQIAALPATLRPGLVVIQGGRDDDGEPCAAEYQAVRQTVADVRARFGDPEIVLLGDVPAGLPVGSSALATNQTIEQAAAAAHVSFVNAIAENWMTPANLPGFHSNIPGHPNDAGHAYIAQRLLADLERLSGDTIAPAV